MNHEILETTILKILNQKEIFKRKRKSIENKSESNEKKGKITKLTFESNSYEKNSQTNVTKKIMNSNQVNSQHQISMRNISQLTTSIHAQHHAFFKLHINKNSQFTISFRQQSLNAFI